MLLEHNITKKSVKFCYWWHYTHITSSKHWHDKVSKILHQELVKQLHLLEEPYSPYYEHEPQVILQNNTCKLYWDHTQLTDKTVISNWPDITLVDKKQQGSCIHCHSNSINPQPTSHNSRKTLQVSETGTWKSGHRGNWTWLLLFHGLVCYGAFLTRLTQYSLPSI